MEKSYTLQELMEHFKIGGAQRLNQVHGCVSTDSLSDGKPWIKEAYDQKPLRMVRGSFGK